MLSRLAPSIVASLMCFVQFPVAAGQMQTVSLPALQAWCATRAMAKSDADQPAVIDQIRGDLVSQLDTALSGAGVAYSGLPFVNSAKRSTAPAASASSTQPTTPDTLNLEVCVGVPPSTDQTPPAPFASRVIPARSYDFMDCENLGEKECIEALRASMLAKYGADKRTQIMESAIMAVRSATGSDPAAIAVAFQSARERATFKAISVTGAGTSAVDLSTKAKRPLLLNSQAALIVKGTPVQGPRVVAIVTP